MSRDPARLHAFGGEAAPDLVTNAWIAYLQLTDEAKAAFWDLLAPVLLEIEPHRTADLLRDYCIRFALDETRIQEAVRGCTILLGRASALDLPVDRFREDLAILSSQNAGASMGPIVERYDATKREIREVMIRGSLADHGKVLLGIDWRVDTMSASDRGAHFETPVVFLTLRYRDGNSEDRVTLQMTRQGLNELRAFTERFKS